jgi:hypothetical protein
VAAHVAFFLAELSRPMSGNHPRCCQGSGGLQRLDDVGPCSRGATQDGRHSGDLGTKAWKCAPSPGTSESRRRRFLGRAVRDACANGAASPGAEWLLPAANVLVNGMSTRTDRPGSRQIYLRIEGVGGSHLGAAAPAAGRIDVTPQLGGRPEHRDLSAVR